MSPNLPSSLNNNDGWDTPKSLLASLLRSEKTIQSLRDTVIKQTGSVDYEISRKPEKEVISEWERRL
jgi:hypothetical protein